MACRPSCFWLVLTRCPFYSMSRFYTDNVYQPSEWLTNGGHNQGKILCKFAGKWRSQLVNNFDARWSNYYYYYYTFFECYKNTHLLIIICFTEVISVDACFSQAHKGCQLLKEKKKSLYSPIGFRYYPTGTHRVQRWWVACWLVCLSSCSMFSLGCGR